MAGLDRFKGTLPYASELFGIYQPLLGWKSKLTQKRFDALRTQAYQTVANHIMSSVRAPVKVQVTGDPREAESALFVTAGIKVSDLVPARFPHGPRPCVARRIDSIVARMVSRRLEGRVPGDWEKVVDPDRMSATLTQIQKILTSSRLLEQDVEIADYVRTFIEGSPAGGRQAVLQSLFERESKMAGYLAFLAQNHAPSLTDLFFKAPSLDIVQTLAFEDPLLNFGANNYEAVLSPIGIIHLYREYFFEFDSFLGPPVGHVWLSPGGTVELIEISTRKVFTERAFETSAELTTRSETETATKDELSDAVKDENQSTIGFGFTNVANYSSPSFQDTATATFSIDDAKSRSRATTHTRMRSQSERLASEIKRNFKTTFKTSTEVTDTSSKRYVLQNTTDQLVNYELRRKMRKVGVQVQDIGTQLCWHTFVNNPGRELGIAKLVHIAKPADLADLPHPDQLEMPQAAQSEVPLSLPFVGIDTDDNDMAYTDGEETEVGDVDEAEHIDPDYPQTVTFDKPGYTLKEVILDPQGNEAQLSAHGVQSAPGSRQGTFTVHLDYVHFHGAASINIKATLVWEPSQELSDAMNAEDGKRLGAYNAEKARRFREAFYNAARERIKFASTIAPRPAEELREEERTVVYRSLISQLVKVGTTESKHVISELVRSIFDVDKMLYFVAPEWWTPRLLASAQHLGEEAAVPAPEPAKKAPKGQTLTPDVFSSLALTTVASPGSAIPGEHIVDWGGAREFGRANYYITEESAPAKLGSSLGWLLQLDGDNLRNAMLNSPWVKAVIPIRTGKEEAAINWLQQAHVEGSDGLDAQYVATPADPPELKSTPGHVVTIRKALEFLIGKIQEYNQNAGTPIVPNPADPEDPSNHFAGSLPTEAVFEHGFYPLQGGVRFDQEGTEQAVFSQWMEILPTDQVAALQVKYDPKTLQIVEPDEGA